MIHVTRGFLAAGMAGERCDGHRTAKMFNVVRKCSTIVACWTYMSYCTLCFIQSYRRTSGCA